ncbi:MAG: hypothetical protein SH857_06650 [Chitinophagales bacterium]|nr:hypothetical protein [Chitinophagales bacterium]
MLRLFNPLLFLLLLICFSCGKTVDCVDFDKVDLTVVCTTDYNPVCGCDDFTYRNSCIAERNGVISWIGGPCP